MYATHYKTFKTSFNGLEVSVTGVYSAYNLSQEEFEILKRTFGAQNINGSNGNYTVFKNAKRKVLLKLFVHESWTPIVFDIRNDLLRLYKSNKLYKDKILDLSKKLKQMRIQLRVMYNYNTKQWTIIEKDYQELLKTIEFLISEQKEENTG